MTQVVFLHGVPDTPYMWKPITDILGLTFDESTAPALPGFVVPCPKGFDKTKEGYVAWFISHLEGIATQYGPVNLVAHDWGGLIASRAISLRPDLIHTWTIINGFPHPENKWHTTARRWQTPILGELMMKLITQKRLARMLLEQGVPQDIANHDAKHFDRDMREAILNLYRSAKTVGTEWYPEFENLPDNGLIIWGDRDPFAPVQMAEAIASRFGLPLKLIEGGGHWSFLEQPDLFCEHLQTHWREAGSQN